MGLMTQLRYLPYRVIRRIGTADISCVLGIEAVDLPQSTLPPGFRFSELSAEQLRALIASGASPFDESQAHDLETGRAHCFAIFYDEAIAAYTWLARGDIPADFNHNGDLMAGLPVQLPADTGFIYNVLVFPKFRGNRLYGCMLSGLVEPMRVCGVTRLILTTDITNHSSLKAVRRMGFQDLGRARLYRLGPVSMASYPAQPVFGDVRFGYYTGDRRRTSRV